MQKLPPSIFNDVIGPVMRGPSSSHTAASVRIGKLIRQFFESEIRSVDIDFTPGGSLATTYSSQGSDIGLVGGLLGMETADPELVNSLEIASGEEVEIGFNIVDYEALHPNTYRINVESKSGDKYCFIFISTGGGMIELQSIDDIPVTINGDYYETLLFFETTDRDVVNEQKVKLEQLMTDLDYCLTYTGEEYSVVNIKTGYPLPSFVLAALKVSIKPAKIVQLEPVMPISSRKNCVVPYSSAEELLKAAEKDNLALWELAVKYESARGNITAGEVERIGNRLIKIMRASVESGLAETDYSDRILEPQAPKMQNYGGRVIGGDQIKKTIAYITAIMDTKSAMGVIVAAPTAGSCGALPGTLIAAAEDLGLNDDAVFKGLMAAAMVGILIASRSTFAAEECGCQAECGSGSGMAAAGLVQITDGTVREALDAAAMALQNIMGLVCDPVADRVEVPCLGKNIMAGVNAIASANMALAGYDNVIPLDETIEALDQVGRMLPSELRCTGRGGLAATDTSKIIARRLSER